ncbi:MAG: hypothetical protein ACYCZX_17605 [Rhodospirillaceae bacterium]
MKKAIVIFSCFCAAVAGAALPSDSKYSPLHATYAITGETILDPSPEEKKDRVSIYIDGDAARQIYKAMPAPEKPYACNDDNSPVRHKTAGGLMCIGDDKKGYSCSVAIKLDDGTTKGASVC